MDPTVPINLFVAGLVTGLLNALGAALKAKSHLPNEWIPFVLSITGAPFYCLLEGWTRPNAGIGIFLGLSAVGLHQAVRMSNNIVKPKDPNETPQ